MYSSRISVKLLVANVINPESWGNPSALTEDPSFPESIPLLTPLQLCSGAGALCHLGSDQMQSLLEVCISPVLSSGWTLGRHDRLLSSFVSTPLWTLSLNLHPDMPENINEPCTKPPFLSSLSLFCRSGTAGGHCLFLGSPLTSSSSSLFLAVPYQVQQ